MGLCNRRARPFPKRVRGRLNRIAVDVRIHPRLELTTCGDGAHGGVAGFPPLFATSPTMGYNVAMQGVVKTSAPAGAVFPTTYLIWHGGGASRLPSVCQLPKYHHWHTTPPTRD